MRIFLLMLKKSWFRFTMSTILSLISGGAYTLFAKFTHEIMMAEDAIGLVKVNLAIGLLLLSTVMAISSCYILSILSEEIVNQLRVDVSNKVLKSNYQYVESNGSKIIPILTEEINKIGILIKKIPEFFTAVATTLGCLIYISWLSWKFSLLVTFIFIIILLLFMLLLPQMRKHEKQLQNNRFRLFGYLKGIITGLRELSLSQKHQDVYVNSVIYSIGKQQVRHRLILNILNTSVLKTSEVIAGTIVLFTLYYMNTTDFFGAINIQDYFFIFIFLLPSLIVIINVFQEFQHVDLTLNRIKELNLTEELGDAKLTVRNESSPFISLHNLEFDHYYKNNITFSVKNINLDISDNEIIFVVGGNGSGKTSLSKLICGLYEPSGGKVIYNNTEINSSNLKAYRSLFSIVFSDSHVFDNLSYLEDNQFNPHIEKYLDLLGLANKISIHDKEIDNIELSQGQMGRLSMLRALLEDRKIYLFDEWAANQDFYFRELFYNEIIPELKRKGKTVILISHDDRYFHIGDRIITLENGTVINDTKTVMSNQSPSRK